MTYTPTSLYYLRTAHKEKKNGWTKRTINRVNLKRQLRAKLGIPANMGGPTIQRIMEIMLDRMTPETRGDCPDERPCPHVSCQYHLKYDESDKGALVENHPDFAWDEIDVTCALDMADSGETTLGTIGALMGMTRERVRQIEQIAIGKLRANDDAADLFMMLKGDE